MQQNQEHKLRQSKHNQDQQKDIRGSPLIEE